MSITFGLNQESNFIPMGLVESTDTSTTTGITYPDISFKIQKYQPTATPDQAIRFTNINRYEYNTSFSNYGYGHHVAGLDWYVHKGVGNSNLAYAHEAKVDNESADSTLNTVVMSEGQLSSNLGTIVNLIGIQSRITGNTGTVITYTGHNVDVTSNSGSISNVIGYKFSDLSSILPLANRVCFSNSDPQAIVVSAAPIIDQSLTYASPSSNNFIVNIPEKRQFMLLTPTSSFANGTINFPPKSSLSDGQTMEITTTQSITSVTFGANGAAFVLYAPAGISQGQTIKFRYFGAIDWWVAV